MSPGKDDENMSKQKVIMGAFRETLHARDAVLELERAGVAPDSISIILPEHVKEEFARIDKSTKAPEGAAIGGAGGLALGALVSGLAAVATIGIPGLGFFAAGPLVAALAGAGAGGATGGALGALVGLGMTEHEAKFHTSVLKEGGIVVAVTTEDKSEQKSADEILDRLAVKSESSKGSVAHV